MIKEMIEESTKTKLAKFENYSRAEVIDLRDQLLSLHWQNLPYIKSGRACGPW